MIRRPTSLMSDGGELFGLKKIDPMIRKYGPGKVRPGAAPTAPQKAFDSMGRRIRQGAAAI